MTTINKHYDTLKPLISSLPGKPGVYQYYDIDGKIIYVACAPIKSKNGDFLGIFGMSIHAQAINEIVAETEVGKSGYAFMVNKKGIVNAHPKEDFILKLDLTTLAGLEDISRDMVSAHIHLSEIVASEEPPRTVKSSAETTIRLPLIWPDPITTFAGVKSMSCPFSSYLAAPVRAPISLKVP